MRIAAPFAFSTSGGLAVHPDSQRTLGLLGSCSDSLDNFNLYKTTLRRLQGMGRGMATCCALHGCFIMGTPLRPPSVRGCKAP
ncbi:hypothetical protein [Acidovorax sp.]|uniref:hypothetical protein n=1 Tax=Acidovorax sp. TaxID=1872122 RepID=UPI002618EFFF|nr:hypothetical protein [Acidovorax sp.]